MHTDKHCCGSGHGRASLEHGKIHTRREASWQIRTEKRTKGSFKKVERSTHGPGSPVHTVSLGGRGRNYIGEQHDYIHFEVCGKWSLVSPGIQGSEARMVKHNQGSQLPQQNNGQTNHFQRIIVAQNRHIGFPFEYGQRKHGLPEEPLTQRDELLSLIEKKTTISGRWVAKAISGGKTSWLSPKSKREFPVIRVEQQIL